MCVEAEGSVCVCGGRGAGYGCEGTGGRVHVWGATSWAESCTHFRFPMCVSRSCPALLLRGLGNLEAELPKAHNGLCLLAPEHHVQTNAQIGSSGKP